MYFARKEESIDVPIVLFSYLNPLLKFGKDRLADEANNAGVDAVLVTDLIPEEAGPWVAAFRDRGMDLVFLDRAHNVGRTIRAHRAAGERVYLRCFRAPVLPASEMKCHATPNRL